MQTNPKKVKTIIFFCVAAIIILLVTSIALTINIHLANKEKKYQQQQIEQLQQIIDDYNNTPNNGDEIITEGD